MTERPPPVRLGIFGGTFDPIHFGHLRMAEETRQQLALDRVFFVPNRVSPLKTTAPRPVTPGALRAEMVRLAIADHPAFALLPVELERGGPSYTIDTLRQIRREDPQADLFLLTGTDAVRDLAKWREPEELLRIARVAVASRPGVDRAEVLARLPAPWAARITFIEMPGLDISATDLRARVRAGSSIRYLVPPPVEAFLRERRLYARDENTQILAEGEKGKTGT